MFQNRKPLKLSQKVDLAALGLSEEIQAQLDSIFAGPSFPLFIGYSERYDLAKQKLQGRVLYWFLAGELRMELSSALKPMWMLAGNPLRRAIPSPNTPRPSKRK